MIELQVVEGQTASPTAFSEEAVMRLVAEAHAKGEVFGVARAGIADIEAGDYTTVAAPATGATCTKA